MTVQNSLNDKLILLNKPQGISSTSIGNKLKRVFSISKLGHVGTLDLEATGLLLLLTGRATRLQNYLLDFEKEYNGTIQLGINTSTDDIYGEIISQNEITILESEQTRLYLQKAIKEKFSGSYIQTAPSVSAKKNNGVPAYKLVREGKEVPLKTKKVNAEIKDISINRSGEVKYHIKVTSGFYVRSLARDIGELSGLGGAAKTINRESVGPFQLSQAISFDELINSEKTLKNPNWAISIDEIYSHLPYDLVILDDPEEINMFLNGNKNLTIIKPSESTSNVIVIDSNKKPVGIINFEQSSNEFKYELVNPVYRKTSCD